MARGRGSTTAAAHLVEVVPDYQSVREDLREGGVTKAAVSAIVPVFELSASSWVVRLRPRPPQVPSTLPIAGRHQSR